MEWLESLKIGISGKNYQIFEKTTKRNFGRFGNIFSMVTASDKDVTRQNAKEYWKIKACRTW